MPAITASVGDGGKNKTHDVALVQAMLRIVKNAKGFPYLATDYDGVYGPNMKKAIATFQQDFGKTVQAGQPGKEKLGYVEMGGASLAALAAALPAKLADLRVIPDTKTVYIADSAANAKASAAAIRGDPEFETVFKDSLARLVDTMYDRHKIVLWLTRTGRRRTFADQAKEVKTHAGPGESNHNFGRAADIGFKNFRWIQGNGKEKQDADWLNALEKLNATKAGAFWDERDRLASKIPLYPLKFERVHLQLYDQATFSNVRSLTKLLQTVGKNQWDAITAPKKSAVYKADFALGGALYAVGTAKEIWAGNATVSKADLASALSAKMKKVVKESDIKSHDITAMQKALKADFEAADANWKQWVKVK